MSNIELAITSEDGGAEIEIRLNLYRHELPRHMMEYQSSDLMMM